MKKVTRTEVEINDIFSFAKDKFGKEWNDCCAIFERTRILPHQGNTGFYLEDLPGQIEYVKKENDVSRVLAYEILLAFMKENKLRKMYYVGPCCE